MTYCIKVAAISGKLFTMCCLKISLLYLNSGSDQHFFFFFYWESKHVENSIVLTIWLSVYNI